MFVLERIEEYAKTTSCQNKRAAVICREESMSFSELDSRSDAFAAYLLGRFGNNSTPVIIYGHKENDFLSVLFGALKSGRAYVPVDTSVPANRLDEIIAEVAPEIIINFSDLQLSAHAEVIDTARLKEILQTPAESEVSAENWVTGDSIAYILFTSGSTGKPKGVPITVNNLTNFYNGLLPYMNVKDINEDGGGVILNQISYSFDVSCCQIYVGLSLGMTLFSVDREMIADAKTLFGYLRKSGLTMWVSTPSFAELAARSAAFCAEQLPYLERFLLCGEVLTHKLCDELAARFPSAQVLNAYGPTETTVLVTAVRVTEEMRRDTRPIPIGYPLSGVELHIADGELLIIGGSVSAGYYNRPDLSEKVFFDDEAGKRGYRTGDICTCEDGLYYYKGRADNQLKLEGYRIEIEDIENNLTRIPNIAKAAVVPVFKDERVQYLAAFIQLEKADGLSSMERTLKIKESAAEFLHAYMIPRKIVVVDAFPLNTSGKTDRKALAESIGTAKL